MALCLRRGHTMRYGAPPHRNHFAASACTRSTRRRNNVTVPFGNGCCAYTFPPRLGPVSVRLGSAPPCGIPFTFVRITPQRHPSGAAPEPNRIVCPLPKASCFSVSKHVYYIHCAIKELKINEFERLVSSL